MTEDFMEVGGGLVPIENGWFLEKETGNKVSPNGDVYSPRGELIWSPDLDEEYER